MRHDTVKFNFTSCIHVTTATCKTMIALITKLSSSYESKPVVRLTVVDEGQPERRQNRRKQGELKVELSMESAG